MGCSMQTILNAAGVLSSAPTDVIAARRDICRECEHATRNPDRLDRPSKGLTTLSVCSETKRQHPEKAGRIAVGTGMPAAACPLGKWGEGADRRITGADAPGE